MSRFLTPTDIANRALQHLGAARINPAFGFAENSKNASEVAYCYDKLRRAELQRNVWTKATHKTAIRPINSRTVILQPTLWSSTVTYFLASVVADAEGTLWESKIRNNLGNDPQNSSMWKPYFGPMTAEPFRSSDAFIEPTNFPSTSFRRSIDAIAYFIGELVYTIKGDGTYNVYRSMTDDNGVHPALPNQWSVDTTYKTDDVVNVYPDWSSATTYSQGQTVNYTDGNTYTSLTNSNLDNIPPNSAANWVMMPTLTLGSSLNPNSTSPLIVPGTTPINEWNIKANYGLGSFVIWNAAIYVSLEANNSGNFPSGADWAQCTGGTLYQSLVDFNLGNTPASSASQWTTTFTLGGGNSLWIQIGGSAFPNGVGIAAYQFTWPASSGPTWEGFKKNVYRLPAGYLRRAPQDPKAGRVSYLGFPSNRPMDDWEYDDDYLLTAMENRPIIFRFVADIRDVGAFHDMFCEGLACRIADEVCEPITQSVDKKRIVMAEYDKFMYEARLQNAVEQGVDEPPLDDFINCRF